jgi:serine/threonine protein kinase
MGDSALAILVGEGSRSLSLERALTEHGWRVLRGRTVFDALKLLAQGPTAIVVDGTVGELKLCRLLSAPALPATCALYSLEGAPARTTSLAGLDDDAVIARLVAKHGGVAPRRPPRAATFRLEPMELWRPADDVGGLVLHADLADVELHERFEQLVTQGGALKHRALPPLLELERTPTSAHASWALPRGLELSELQRLLRHHRERLPFEAVCALAVELAEVLSLAHAAGVMFGMVRPRNVWVTEDGDFRVLFAAVGRLCEDDRAQRRTGLVVLRNDDLAPEQLRGAPRTPATDVYQLGHLLFELLTGHSPFARGDSFEAMSAVLTAERPHAISLAGDVPGPLSLLLQAMLALDPATRPTAPQVREAFEPHVPTQLGPAAAKVSAWVARFEVELG